MARQDEANSRADRSRDEELLPYERILAHGIKEVVSELCLVDANVLTSYICNNFHANIEDLVDSSSELFLKEGFLRYSHAANLDFEWGKSPAVILDMEFIHPTVSVFFKLVLHGLYMGVAIQRILVSDRQEQGWLELERFANAVNDARLVPMAAPATF